jgi:gentisate 1,2-dioxygenase
MAAAREPVSDARRAFYAHLRTKHLAPLWEVLRGLVTPAPVTPLVPALWRYAEVRPEVMAAGRLISAEEAERRVLILENPALHGHSAITQSLYAGLQLLLPGETARSHRHTQSALRLVMEGEGAYTAVDGERRTMRRGDFIITPNWTWHDHGNPGSDPVVWLDGLDIPLVRFLDASFAEHAQREVQPQLRPEGDSLARYGHNLVPLDYQPRRAEAARLFVYPYEQTRDALRGIATGPADPHFGHALRFVNPGTGASPMPTIGVWVQSLPKGMETRPRRGSDGTVYLCLEGEGAAMIGERSFEFSESDVFVVPSWCALSLHARRELVLFAFSDQPVQQALGLWREERL